MDDTRPEVAVLSREPGYAFDNAWEEARRRPGLLEEVSDPDTIRHLEGCRARVRCTPGGSRVSPW